MGVVGQLPLGRVEKRPRHPEVHQERATRLEPNNQILAAAIDGLDPLSLELRSHLERLERSCQSRVGDLDPRERAPHERGLEHAPDSLDFGKLGHGRTVPAGL